MASALGNIMQPILDWASTADSRYREARKMMELDDHILEDIGITRQELLEELGMRKAPGNKVLPLGRRQTNYWSRLANSRMSHAEL